MNLKLTQLSKKWRESTLIEINKKSVVLALGYMVFSSFLFLILKNSDTFNYQHWQMTASIIVLIHLIVVIICYKSIGIDLLSTSSVITILIYLFHLSQLLIKLFSKEYKFNFDVSMIIPKYDYIESIEYTFLILSVLVFGILLMKSFKISSKFKNNRLSRSNYNRLSTLSNDGYYKLGIIVFVVTFPIEAFILIQRFIIARSSGYTAIYDVGGSGIISLIGTFSIIGIVMILIGCQNKKRKATMIFLSYALFYLFTMFSGGRMWQLIKLLIVFYYYLKIINIKVGTKNALLMSISVYLLAGFVSSISDFRGEGIADIGVVIETIKNVYNNNPFLNAIEEFGGTIYTMGLTIGKIPGTIDFSHGKQFFTGIVSILPNLSESIDNINVESNFVNSINVKAIGGSLIAEMYYSFGYYAVIPALFLGMFIQFLTRVIEKSIENKDYTNIIYSVLIQYSMLSWVRGASIIFYRNVFFSFAFIYIITIIFIRRKNKNDKNIRSYVGV